MAGPTALGMASSAPAMPMRPIEESYRPPEAPRVDVSSWYVEQDEHGRWCAERAVVEEHPAEGWLACSLQRVYPTGPEGCTDEEWRWRAERLVRVLCRIYHT